MDPVREVRPDSLSELIDQLRKAIADARDEGIQEGYKRGFVAGEGTSEEHVRQAVKATEARIAEATAEAYGRGKAEAENRLHAEFERERRAWFSEQADLERRRVEANLKEAEERGLAFDRALREREKALEERLEKDYGEQIRNLETRVAERETARQARRTGAIPRGSAKDDGYQQGFQTGYEQGRREVETSVQSRINEAMRLGYEDGLAARRGGVPGSEGSRSWALGVMHLTEAASADEIRQQYRKLSRMWHPDRSPELGDGFIKDLNRAREVLDPG